MQEHENWGGARPNSGRKPRPKPGVVPSADDERFAAGFLVGVMRDEGANLGARVRSAVAVLELATIGGIQSQAVSTEKPGPGAASGAVESTQSMPNSNGDGVPVAALFGFPGLDED